MAGYIRSKHASLTRFINLFQECRLHPSRSMQLANFLGGSRFITKLQSSLPAFATNTKIEPMPPLIETLDEKLLKMHMFE